MLTFRGCYVAFSEALTSYDVLSTPVRALLLRTVLVVPDEEPLSSFPVVFEHRTPIQHQDVWQPGGREGGNLAIWEYEDTTAYNTALNGPFSV